MNIHVYLTMKVVTHYLLKVMNYENTTYNDAHIPNVSNTFIFHFYPGVFITKGDVGVGTIVGSAVFNILVVIGLCGILAGEVHTCR